jgi:hypothetical protein
MRHDIAPTNAIISNTGSITPMVMIESAYPVRKAGLSAVSSWLVEEGRFQLSVLDKEISVFDVN